MVRPDPIPYQLLEYEPIASPDVSGDALDIDQLLAPLPKRWSRLLREWAGGATYQDIADAEGVSRQRAFQLIQMAIDRVQHPQR